MTLHAMSGDPDLDPPVLLLDVDGVVNATRPGPGFNTAPRQGFAFANGLEWKMRWAPKVVEQLAAWHRHGRVEMRWATTWCPFADQLERMWRFPALQRCLTQEDVATRETANAAKLRAALDVVQSQARRLVWADDEAIPDDTATLARLRPSPATTLLLTPRSSRGLGRDDLELIEAFLDRGF